MYASWRAESWRRSSQALMRNSFCSTSRVRRGGASGRISRALGFEGSASVENGIGIARSSCSDTVHCASSTSRSITTSWTLSDSIVDSVTIRRNAENHATTSVYCSGDGGGSGGGGGGGDGGGSEGGGGSAVIRASNAALRKAKSAPDRRSVAWSRSSSASAVALA